LDDLDKEKTVRFIEECRNFDGGFGMVEGAESHAAYGASFSLALEG
jgi:geranylgeranyl transferase type-2 subunit beta